MVKPEEVLQLANELVHAKSRVAHLQRQWDALFPTDAPPNPPRPSKRKGRGAQESSLASRIVRLMDASPEVAMDVSTVARELNEHDMVKVRRALDKLVFKGKIQRRGRGLAGALTEENLQMVS